MPTKCNELIASRCTLDYHHNGPCCPDFTPLERELLGALEHLTGLFAALHPNHADWGDYKAARAAIAKATR